MASAAPKRSLFKKPAWASTSASTPVEEEEEDIFHPRPLVYAGILEQQRRDKEEGAAKAKAEAEKAESTRETKRRRISDENKGDGSDGSRALSDDGRNMNTHEHRRVTRSTPDKKKRLPWLEKSTSRSPTSQATTMQPKSSQTEIVDLDAGDDDDYDDIISMSTMVVKKTSTKPKLKSKYAEALFDEDDEEDDDYTRGLREKAREKARLQKLGLGTGNPPLPTPPGASFPQPPADQPNSGSLQHGTDPNSKLPCLPTAEDPFVRLKISTSIPGAKGLVVNRRASQSLKQVKEVWCHRQGFDENQTVKIFLTWRGAKLFNSSTVKPILDRLKAERPNEEFVFPEIDESEPNPQLKGIELEAMTEKIFEEYQRARERKSLAAASAGTDEDDHDSAEEEDRVVRPPQDGIVVQLACQGRPTISLRVRPNTSVAKIMNGYKTLQNIDQDKTCWLVFEGERLELDATVQSLDLQEEDVVEVHLR